MVKKRALDEYRDDYDKPVDRKCHRWSDFLDRKLEAGEFDKLEKRAKQIDQYETRVHEKAAEVEAESQVGRVETKTERKIPTAA